jgi:hypothetical protein
MVFVIFICCCGLSLIFLAAFLWRKYTRATNCDTTSSNMQQQYQVSEMFFLSSLIEIILRIPTS